MADDDVDLSAPAGIVANDEIAGKKYQRIKSGWGADGTWNETDTASGKPFPTQLRTPTGTAGSFGAGATDAGTLRVVLPTDQMGALGQNVPAGSVPTVNAKLKYEVVAASDTDEIIGTGTVGDYLEALVCVVSTAATSQVQIKDGDGSAITVLPNNVGGGVGTYYVPLGLACVNATTPGWKITTAAGVSAIATGSWA